MLMGIQVWDAAHSSHRLGACAALAQPSSGLGGIEKFSWEAD